MPVKLQAALERCFAEIRVARAAELARSGRLLEARGVLVPNGELPSSPHELDLLARIAARQGRFDEARRMWSAAIQLEPGNVAFRQCLEDLTPGRRMARVIANSQDALLTVLFWATITFGIGVSVFVCCVK